MAGEQELSTSFNPLDDADYRDSLHHFFEFYNNSQDVFELATWESNGKRPMHLENEIYSAFHHVNRSLFNCKSIDYAKDQIEHAKNSHLMRVQYDSYKIALHAILERSDKVVSDFEFLLVDEDFRSILTEAVQIFKDIRSKRLELKNHYLKAKDFERKGYYDKAINAYNSAIDSSKSLQDEIDRIENDKLFKVAVIAVKKKEARSNRIEKNSLRNVIISGLIILLINLFMNVCFKKDCITLDDKSSVKHSDQLNNKK